MSSWIVSRPDRLDAFLMQQGGFESRVKAQRSIEAGEVTVNEEVTTKPSFRVQEGDKIVLTLQEVPASESSIEPTDLHLTVLYEDASCFVIEKPAGIAVHPGAGMLPGEVTILHGVAYLFRERSLPFSSDATLVHRLDRDTTGCLLIAKTSEAHRALQSQFETRTVDKKYLALVAGIPEHASATVDSPIGRSATNRIKMSVQSPTKTREAQTSYEVISQGDRYALLACKLHTGRTHQIRVHLSAIGHPVLGDAQYNTPLSERITADHDIRTLCLHAWKLGFVSPATKSAQAITANVPAAMQEVLERVGAQLPS